jgi:hypothetical protein
MLNWQFIVQNLNFAISLFMGLVAFAMFWLTYDAWTVQRSRRELVKLGGFALLAFGFILHSTQQQHAVAGSLTATVDAVSTALRLLAYALLATGQILDPIQPRPVYEPDPEPEHLSAPLVPPLPSAPIQPELKPVSVAANKPKPTKIAVKKNLALAFLPVTQLIALPLGALAVAGLYWRHATVGLERHLKPLAYGFALLAVFELLIGLGNIDTSNPLWYRLVESGGVIPVAAIVVLLVATLILGRWVWQYLTKRIQSQLFMILVAQTVAIFLVSTISFTFLLLSRTQSQSLADLNTASHVLDYALKSRQAETAAQADAVSSRPLIVSAIAARDHKYLTTALADYMPKHGLTSLVIMDASAAVLLRGEDPERWGDSRSSDILVRRALVGESATSVVVRDGVVAPSVMIMAATPARDAAGNIVGVVMAGRTISNAFVDGIKSSTGLDSAVYGGNVRAATTLVSTGGAGRAVGIKEASAAINERVLKQGKDFSGELSLQNRPYLVAYAPLKDANNVPVGMLLVARPLDALFATANSSVEFTFLLVVIMLAISVVPVYYISRYISRQLH